MAGGGMNILGGVSPFSMYSPRGPVSPFRGNIVPSQQMRVQAGPYSLTNPTNAYPPVNTVPQQTQVPMWSSPSPYAMGNYFGMQNQQAIPALVNPFSFNSPPPVSPVSLRADQMALAPEVLQSAPAPDLVGGLQAMRGGGAVKFAAGGTTDLWNTWGTSAQDTYDRVIRLGTSSEYRDWYNSLAPSTQAYTNPPATGPNDPLWMGLAEREQSNWIAFQGTDPFNTPPPPTTSAPSITTLRTEAPTTRPPVTTIPPTGTGTHTGTLTSSPTPTGSVTTPWVSYRTQPPTTATIPVTKQPTLCPPPSSKDPSRATFEPWITQSAVPVSKPGFTPAPTGTGLPSVPPITIGALASFAELAKKYPYAGPTSFGQTPAIPYGLPFVPPEATIPPAYITPRPGLRLPTFSLPPVLRETTPFAFSPPQETLPPIIQDPIDIFYPNPQFEPSAPQPMAPAPQFNPYPAQDYSSIIQQLVAIQKYIEDQKAAQLANPQPTSISLPPIVEDPIDIFYPNPVYQPPNPTFTLLPPETSRPQPILTPQPEETLPPIPEGDPYEIFYPPPIYQPPPPIYQPSPSIYQPLSEEPLPPMMGDPYTAFYPEFMPVAPEAAPAEARKGGIVSLLDKKKKPAKKRKK